MKRVRQTFAEITESLSLLEVDWMVDPVASAVIKALRELPVKAAYPPAFHPPDPGPASCAAGSAWYSSCQRSDVARG